MPRSLVITGMHRSGTSLTASLAARAGIDIGSTLLPAGPGNPRGHFEDTEFLQFHMGLLSRRGSGPLCLPSGWSFVPSAAEEDEARSLVERRSALPVWGFKDPRTTLFLDFWDRLLPDPVYVFLYRHPVEVALSLVRRGLEKEVLQDPSAAIRSWEEHNVRLLDFRSAHPGRCLLWNASGMVRSIGPAFRTLAERLGHALRIDDLEGLYFPGEFHEGLAAPEIDWREILPAASRIHAALEEEADLGSPPGTARAGGPPDGQRALLRAEEHLLAAVLRTAAERDRLVGVSDDLATSLETAADLRAQVKAHEEAWESLAATRGFRLLRAWWTGVESVSRLRAGRNRLAPRDVLVGCVTENDAAGLARVHRLIQSVRWFGGSLASARLMVCAVEGIEPGSRSVFEALGAEVRVVPRFDTRNPFANKLQFFPEAARTGMPFYLLLDCDTLVVGDPLSLIAPGVFQAKIADLPSVTHDVFERVFERWRLPLPPRSYETTFDATPTIRYCNSGVIAVPAGLAAEFVPVWRELNARMLDDLALLSPCEKHVNQASLSLAFVKRPVPFRVAPVALNFPLNLAHLPAPPGMLAADPVILHYHTLVDEQGYLLPSPYPRAQERIEAFNQRLRRERENPL